MHLRVKPLKGSFYQPLLFSFFLPFSLCALFNAFALLPARCSGAPTTPWTMWFTKTITKHLMLDPRFFGPSLSETIKAKATGELEGRLYGTLGYIVAIVNLDEDEISFSTLNQITGKVNVRVKLDVIMFRLFKNEVVDCVVRSTNDLGFYCECGVMTVFVSRQNMPPSYQYENGEWTSVFEEGGGDEYGGYDNEDEEEDEEDRMITEIIRNNAIVRFLFFCTI